MRTKTSSAKSIYLLFALFFVALLVIVFALWDKPGNKTTRPVAIKSNKPFYQPQKLSERTSTQWGALVKKDLKGPVQGKVGIIDWCSKTVFIGDVPFNMGSLDLVGTIDTGDLVELMYEDTTQGKVIASIHVLSKKNSEPFTIKSNKPFYDPSRLPPRTPPQQAAPASVPKDIKGPVQGKVGIIDWCSGTVVIDGIHYSMGSRDLAGTIKTGDSVQLTYEDKKQGKVIESIQVLR